MLIILINYAIIFNIYLSGDSSYTYKFMFYSKKLDPEIIC